MLTSGSPRQRERAATALGALRSPLATQALTRALHDRNTNVALAAAAALAGMGGLGIDAVANALHDENAWVRVVAASGLATVQDRRGLPVLSDALNSEDIDIYDPAVRALARLGEPGTSIIIAALDSAGSPRHLKEIAASVLGGVSGAAARQALARAAASGDMYVRRAAERALSR